MSVDCFTWWWYMIWLGFDDVTTWHDDIDKYIWFLYDDSYEGFHPDFAGFTRIITSFAGFTRVIRWWLRSYEAPMDGPMEMSHMGLIYMWCTPLVGGVAGVSTTTVWGGVGMPRYCRVTYPDQHQCRALYMIFYGFTILKLIRIMFLTCIYIIKRNTGGLWRRIGTALPIKV